jgi:hypothetical protein
MRETMLIWISRLFLALAGLMTLLLALSLPAPRYATSFSLAIQALYFLISAGSFVAMFLIGRPGKGGRLLVALLGLTAILLLAFNARAIVAGFRHQAPLSPLTSLMIMTPWIALLIAAAGSIRPLTGAGESR